MLRAVVIVLGLVVVGLLLDQALLAAERRGWIYWRRQKASTSAAANAMQSVAEIWAPEQHHAVEERKQFDADEAEDDDPLSPG